MLKPRKKGQLGNVEDKLLLTNEDNESFEVHETTVYLWESCDGTKDVKDITTELANKLSIDTDRRAELGRVISLSINQLKDRRLIDLE